MTELKCCWDGMKRAAVVITLQTLKQRALNNPLVEHRLPVLLQVGISQRINHSY